MVKYLSKLSVLYKLSALSALSELCALAALSALSTVLGQVKIVEISKCFQNSNFGEKKLNFC